LAYLSKVAAIVYAHADKLIIGSLISMEGLAYYAVPATLVNRLLGMTFRLSSVVYPSASELKAKDDMASLKLIYFYAVKYVFFINAFFVLLICLFGREILNHWIGPNFSKEGSLVVVLIALAMLIDSITNIPSLVNDGFGHPRITGLFAIMRAALGLLAIFAFAKSYGIVGVAVGHLLSSAVMAATFTIYVHRHTIPFSLSLTVKHAYLPTFIASVVMGGAFLLFRPAHTLNLWQTMLVAATIATIMLLFGVRFVMDVTHRNAVISSIKKMISARSEGIR
jgi:O-antigen/teichoic acid export membrane protein